jgi:hypothetical protein
MRIQVTARVTFTADRKMWMYLHGPKGTSEVGIIPRSQDIGPIARARAATIYEGSHVDLDVEVEQPPWLTRGLIVRLAAEAVDPAEGASHPWAQVVGFLPVGGVLVVHPETGAGVQPPEMLMAADAHLIEPSVLTAIVQRTGISPIF